MKGGHVAVTVFPVWHARFCEQVLLQGQNWGQNLGRNFVPTTCCMKFSWFELVRHEAGTKWPKIFNVASCALFLQTVPATTHLNVSIRFMCTSLHTVPATCILCVHTMGACPRYMSPSMFRSWGRDAGDKKHGKGPNNKPTLECLFNLKVFLTAWSQSLHNLQQHQLGEDDYLQGLLMTTASSVWTGNSVGTSRFMWYPVLCGRQVCRVGVVFCVDFEFCFVWG